MKKIILILSLIFTVLSFIPSVYEIYRVKDMPKEREFVLEHNYMYDLSSFTMPSHIVSLYTHIRI